MVELNNVDLNKSKLDKMNDIYKTPIFYNEQVKQLNKNIVNDLELNKTIEESNENKPIYNYVFKPSLSLGENVLKSLSTAYTTDTTFLKETQEMIKNISISEINKIYNKHNLCDHNIEEAVFAWEEIKSETSFCEKYLYIDWEFAKFINNNPNFLQFMSIYNIASPILSLCLPIFMLIVPFFIIKIKGIDLNLKEYIQILKQLIANHSISKLFTNFNDVTFNEKIYLSVTSAFYLFSIYQNILVCVKFYSNMKKIHDYLFKIKKYVAFTIDLMKYHLTISNELTKYNNYNNQLKEKLGVLIYFKDELDKISPFSFSFTKMTQIGHILCMFYQLYDNPIYHDVLLYSFGFNGYSNLLSGLKTNIDSNKLNKANFVSSSTNTDSESKKTKTKTKSKSQKNVKPIFKNMYYPKFIDEENIITNDCDLEKNMIITGPNASGKTTTLKSTLINILLSQQIGFGCFEKLKFSPYHNIHCYLNIPDTSGRDSLFQAEARRCKEIIDSIEDNEDELHFCIFDELYSGTNPEEAVDSAAAFMDYIVKNDNTTCLLTTHYIKLCKKMKKNKKFQNYNMISIKKKNNLLYTYKLTKGISKIKGGFKVLSDMNYPREILEQTQTIMN
jgi:hypothetical protein